MPSDQYSGGGRLKSAFFVRISVRTLPSVGPIIKSTANSRDDIMRKEINEVLLISTSIGPKPLKTMARNELSDVSILHKQPKYLYSCFKFKMKLTNQIQLYTEQCYCFH